MTTAAGTPLPLDGAALLEILARPPKGPTKRWPATAVDGDAAGVLGYVTQAGDLAEFGRWRLQPRAVFDGADRRGVAIPLEVVVAEDA